MSKVKQDAQPFEFGIYESCLALWENKFKIISIGIVALIFGGLIELTKEEIKTAKQEIYLSSPSIFTRYLSVNWLLKKTNVEYTVSNESIFHIFINQLNDHGKYKRESLIASGIKPTSDVKRLIDSIQVNTRPGGSIDQEIIGELVFQYTEPNSAKIVSEALIIDALKRSSEIIKLDIENIQNALIISKEVDLNISKNKINDIKDTIKVKEKSKLLFLEEQSKLAVDLGIKEGVGQILKARNKANGNVVLNLPNIHLPYYVYGQKAIVKEIDIIKARSSDAKYLLDNEYISALHEYNATNKYETINQIDKAKNIFDDNKFKDWVRYDPDDIKITSNKRTILFSLLSCIAAVLLSGLFFIQKTLFQRIKFNTEDVGLYDMKDRNSA